jgi:hypothetical protein
VGNRDGILRPQLPKSLQPGFDGLLARARIDAANGFKFVAYLLTYRDEFDITGLDKGVRFTFENLVLAKLFTHMSRKTVSGAIALTKNYPVTSQVDYIG